MAIGQYRTALIVGAGEGLSSSLARLLSREGLGIALAARRADKLATLARETNAEVFACDASDRGQVERLFVDMETRVGAPDVVIYNASGRVRGPFLDLDPAEVERTLAVSAYGGFLVAQQAVRRMLPKG